MILQIWGARLVSSFRIQEFRWYWIGNVLVHITFLLQNVALAWQMLEVTNSAFGVGMVAFAYGLPLLIVSPLAGLLADRMKRQWIIQFALSLAVFASACLAYLSANGGVTSGQILITSFVLGSAFSIYAPARMALLPSLVPGDMIFNATTLSYSGTRLMGFFGPVLAGTLLHVSGIVSTLLIQTLLFGVGAAIYYKATHSLPRPLQNKTRGLGIFQGLWELIVYLRQDRSLFALALLGLVFVPIGMPYLKLMPVYVNDVLGEGPAILGLMVGCASLGAALSGLAIAAIGDIYRKGLAILVFSICFGVTMIVFAFTSNPVIALALIFAMGVFSGVFLTMSNVLLLTQMPDELRGRAMSMWSMVWGLIPLTALIAGAVAEYWGISIVLILAGVSVTITCILMLTKRSQLLAL
jgi:MFS family permease